MKRTPILLAAFMLSTLGVFGQGQIRFFNNGQTLISTNSMSGGESGLISGAGNYYFALFVAPAGTADPGDFTFTGFYGTNRSTAGILRGGDGVGHVTFPYSPGTTLSFLVRGWSATIGTDYSAVTSYLSNPTFPGWYGESRIGLNVLGGGATPVPDLFGIGVGHLYGFTLEVYGVPEPSSLAFAGLGLAAMWILRRR
ncbi:MAG TPA: PEP-CTERM sorting domain-containing protein [Verrucomicrobiae bacterium]|nr:PEP-CTERM sorting domain-containing protein [Verrucomicrobiae bacterium]